MSDMPGSDVLALPRPPMVRPVTAADIRASLAEGWRDFCRAPLYGLFFGGFYAAGGLLLVAFVRWLDMSYMAYALAIGFPLIGPFVAVGLYEVSRRLKSGRPLSWSGVLATMWAQRGRELSWMAFVTLFVLWIWIYQVRLLIALFLGFKSFSSLDRFIDVVLTSSEGLWFLAIGHVVGAALYAILFSVTVISFPLLLDREVDFITAMITSVKVVLTSPVVMLSWALVILAAMAAAIVPAFLGLLVILPVLGHASWHLYERAVEPAG